MKENNNRTTTITEEVPEWKLKLAYFYAEHKILLRRALVFAIFFLDLIVVFLLGSLYVNYKTGLISDENYLWSLPKNLVNNNIIKQQMAPEELKLGEVKILRSDTGKNNFLAVAENDNADWAVKNITYAFFANGQELGQRSTFILPKSSKYLMYFNAPASNSAEIKIINLSWERIRDYSLISYKDEVKIESAKFVPGNSDIISGQVNFTIRNETAFNFWEVGLPVVLYDQFLEPLAINYAVINRLKSLEERAVSFSWQEPIYRAVESVGVYPEIDLLNKSAIMKIDAGPGEPAGLEIN